MSAIQALRGEIAALDALSESIASDIKRMSARAADWRGREQAWQIVNAASPQMRHSKRAIVCACQIIRNDSQSKPWEVSRACVVQWAMGPDSDWTAA